jgi:hypothetical protein
MMFRSANPRQIVTQSRQTKTPFFKTKTNYNKFRINDAEPKTTTKTTTKTATTTQTYSNPTQSKTQKDLKPFSLARKQILGDISLSPI